MNQPLNIEQAITNLRSAVANADSRFEDMIYNPGDELNDAGWRIETCFLILLTIVEALGLSELHKMILSEYASIKGSKKGFVENEIVGGEPFSVCLSRIRQFLRVIEQFFPQKEPTMISKDVLQIIRDIHYTITDKALFANVPKDEKDVHIRIEGILKCVFPDLKHKPTLTKQIKNFEPDTGIPSIETLIEYKFLSRAEDVPVIADQVLADTRGYTSKDWKRFIYVIYETNRFKREKEWVQLLRQSGVPENTTVVVLSGEPPARSKKKKIATKIV